MLKTRIFKDNEIKKITILKRNALLKTITNPGAIHVRNQIQVINPTNNSLTPEECEIIENLLNIESKR